MIGRGVCLLVLAGTLLAPAASFASCSVPTGTAGDFIYNSTYNVAQYCNGTNWINMGTNTGGVGTLTSGDICTTDGTNVNCTLASPLTGTYGGTGINNGSNTLTIGGSVTYSGAHTVTWTTTGTTTLTLPTSGTLETTSLVSGDIWVGSASSAATAQALSGDCTLSNAGAITCTKTSGTAFGTLATASTPLSVANGGTGVTSAQGNGILQLGTATPTPTSGHCVQFDSHGNVQDAGAACGSGGGTAAVTAGGTGDTTLTSNGVLYGNGTSAVQVTAQGGANTILIANSGAPSWSSSPTIGGTVTAGTFTANGGAQYATDRIYFSAGTYYVLQTSTSVGVNLCGGCTSWGAQSDIRLKDIIEPLTGGLEKVKQIRPVIYRFKKDDPDRRRSGIIAQDIQKVLPEAVYKDKDGYLNVTYTELIPLTISAIQELKAENDELRQEIKDLRREVRAQ